MSRHEAKLGGLAGILGVALLILSFAINSGAPPSASMPELLAFGHQHYRSILWGAWMQAVGPVLIILFAFTLVFLAGAERRLAGWMTLLGATILMMVSLIEITFYMSALHTDPDTLPFISLQLIAAVQHLYFIVAAPALFVPLGVILVRSSVLPRAFGYLALVLAAIFGGLGVAFLLDLTLPAPVTAVAGVQALWWLAAAVTLLLRGERAHPITLPTAEER